MTDPEPETEADAGRKTRRQVLGLLGGLGAAAVVAGCGGGTGTSQSVRRASGSTTTAATTNGASTSTTATTDAAGTLSSCSKIPEETEGPFPGDGSNGPNVLTEDGVVRGDIRSSIGSASGVAKGVPLTVELTVVDASTCAPRAGAAVYVWHCDMNGGYSMYSQGVSNENYLRGVQATDANGKASFQSIFPACYAGRWPHIHFEVFHQARVQQDRDIADGIAEGRLHRRVRNVGIQPECDEPLAGVARNRHGVQRRRVTAGAHVHR
jgi:protocatechuate 3,4-dioxygenase beta subunit